MLRGFPSSLGGRGALWAALLSIPACPQAVGPQPDGSFLLHTGWRLRPAGRQIPLGAFPMSMALDPAGQHLLILNAGREPPSISVIELASEREVARAPVEDGWLGLAFHPRGDRLYVGGGSRPFVFEHIFEGGQLRPARRMAVARDPRSSDHVGDVAVSPDGRFLYAANVFRNVVTVLNTQTGAVVSEISTGRRPYRILFAPDGKTFFVSHWAEGTVGRYDAAGGARRETIAAGPHPTDLLYLPGGNDPAGNEPLFQARLFVACANTNSVTVLGIGEDGRARLIERIHLAPAPRTPAGATPSALALAPDGRLLVACSDNNTVAVVDVGGYPSVVEGFLPAGWYPTAVRAAPDGRVFIANGKGPAAGSAGSLSVVPAPDQQRLAAYTRDAARNRPYQNGRLIDAGGGSGGANPVPSQPGDSSPLQHVVYILKGNRSYDEVLGDLKQGNGEAGLARLGESVTPNHHKLAREFVLLDNFYVMGEDGPEGHDWSTAAIAGDFLQKIWPARWAGRRKFDDFQGAEPAAFPPAGYLWGNALSAGISLRNYGFRVENNEALTGVARVLDPALEPHTNRNYPGFSLEYSDQKRAGEFLREFAELAGKGALPRLLLVRLANDHAAAAPGQLAAVSLAADNDSALGRIVETISRSPLWGRTAIFVLEEGAGGGPDHVDPHRSPAFVLSPYTRRGAVDSTHYTTVSALRTMELILGLRPMTQFDAGATPMSASFAARPDPRPYVAEKPRVP